MIVICGMCGLFGMCVVFVMCVMYGMVVLCWLGMPICLFGCYYVCGYAFYVVITCVVTRALYVVVVSAL